MPNKCCKRIAERKINELHGRTMGQSHEPRVYCVDKRPTQKIDSIETENGIFMIKRRKTAETIIKVPTRFHSFELFSFHSFVFASVPANSGNLRTKRRRRKKARYCCGAVRTVRAVFHHDNAWRAGPQLTNFCGAMYGTANSSGDHQQQQQQQQRKEEKNKSIFLTFIRLNTVRYFCCRRHEDSLKCECYVG